MSETILSWAKRSLFSIKSYGAKQRGGASLRPVAKIQIQLGYLMYLSTMDWSVPSAVNSDSALLTFSSRSVFSLAMAMA